MPPWHALCHSSTSQAAQLFQRCTHAQHMHCITVTLRLFIVVGATMSHVPRPCKNSLYHAFEPVWCTTSCGFAASPHAVHNKQARSTFFHKCTKSPVFVLQHPPRITLDNNMQWVDSCSVFHPAVRAVAGRCVRITEAQLQNVVTAKDGLVLRGAAAASVLANAPHPDDHAQMKVHVAPGIHARTWQCAHQLLTTGGMDLLKRAQRMMVRLADEGAHDKLDTFGLVNDYVLHPDEATGGFCILLGPHHGCLGQSTQLKARHAQHLTKCKLAARRTPMPKPCDVDITTGSDSKCEHMAATGHQPVMIVLASCGPVPARPLGTDEPWSAVLRNPVDAFGNSNRATIIQRMRGQEGYFMNQLRPSAITRCPAANAWRRIPPNVKSRVEGLDDSKVERHGSHLKRMQLNRKSHRPPPKTIGGTCVPHPVAQKTLLLWSTAACTPLPSLPHAPRLRANGKTCDRAPSGWWQPAPAYALLCSLSGGLLYDCLLLLLHRRENAIPGPNAMTPNALRTLQDQITSLICKKNCNAPGLEEQQALLFDFVHEACGHNAGTLVAEALTCAAEAANAVLPAEAVQALRIRWRTMSPLRLHLMNHNQFQRHQHPNVTCHCDNYPDAYKRAMPDDPTDENSTTTMHVCTHDLSIVRCLARTRTTTCRRPSTGKVKPWPLG